MEVLFIPTAELRILPDCANKWEKHTPWPKYTHTLFWLTLKRIIRSWGVSSKPQLVKSTNTKPTHKPTHWHISLGLSPLTRRPRFEWSPSIFVQAFGARARLWQRDRVWVRVRACVGGVHQKSSLSGFLESKFVLKANLRGAPLLHRKLFKLWWKKKTLQNSAEGLRVQTRAAWFQGPADVLLISHEKISCSTETKQLQSSLSHLGYFMQLLREKTASSALKPSCTRTQIE